MYHPRDLVALRAKLRYTTLIVLPEGEDVVEATCGDKEFWIVNVRGGLVSVKPAKAGSETNLNLVTTSGQVYAFLLTEVSRGQGPGRDLTVYLEPDDARRRRHAPRTRPKFVPGGAARGLPRAGRPGARAGAARDRGGAGRTRGRPHGVSHAATRSPAVSRIASRRTPSRSSCARCFTTITGRSSSLARANCPRCTRSRTASPNLVNFEVQDGTYVIPKVLDDGYLMIGKQRMAFRRVDGK